jgi:hexosaminidase
MKKYARGVLCLAGAMLSLFALDGCQPRQMATVSNYDVIPQPRQVELLDQKAPFVLDQNTQVLYGTEVDLRDAEFLRDYIAEATSIRLAEPILFDVTKVPARTPIIVLGIEPSATQPEGYTITIDSLGVNIVGGSADGLFYGIQTLRKTLPVGKFCSVELPAARVVDYPRFGYRGMHLDIARHFQDVEFIKKYIDLLALHNINTFHWHLVDDQGWRVQIKKYPLLTTISTTRKQTVIGRNSGVWDGKPYGEGMFYTQDELREVVEYARERHIDIIPEIDMPGHMVAALAAYPELGCTGGPYDVWTIWGVSEDLLCAGNDQTIQFCKDILDEIVEIFPYEYIHIGGDECPKVRWEECPKCQARIDAEHLHHTSAKSPEEALQGWFMRQMSDHLAKYGKKVIGWDEVLDGENLGENMVIMSWRGDAGGIKAAKRGVPAIMVPNNLLYFDYYQTKEVDREPFAIGGYNPIENVYAYDPLAKIPAESQKYIIGVQANIWTEYIHTTDHIEHMALPRMSALAEVQWSDPEQKDYDRFLVRLQPMLDRYRALGYNYAPYVLDVVADLSPAKGERALRATLTTLDGAPIHYTLDGSDPTPRSPQYSSEGVIINKTATLRASAHRYGRMSQPMVVDVSFSEATLCPITLLTTPAESYTFGGAPVLVDGMVGNKNYRTGRWLGFYNTPCVAQIDLGEMKKTSRVKFNVCVNKDDGCMDARGVKVWLSDDAQQWSEVVSEEYAPMTLEDDHGLYHHTVEYAPTEARYVKVEIACEHSIPSWHAYFPGAQGFLFVDEISVE